MNRVDWNDGAVVFGALGSRLSVRVETHDTPFAIEAIANEAERLARRLRILASERRQAGQVKP